MIFTIDNNTVASLAKNGKITKAFPFFVRRIIVKKGCKTCGGSGAVGMSASDIMRSLLALTPNQQQVFKNLIGADVVVGTVVRAARSIKESF